MKYQGWTNQSTWQIHVMVSKTEWLYQTVQAMVTATNQNDCLPEYLLELISRIKADAIDNFSLLDIPNDIADVELTKVNWEELALNFSLNNQDVA